MVDQAQFIADNLAVAQEHSARTGIPADVYLAIGASESNWGAAGSIFGIKGSSPSGKSTRYKTWESVDGQRVNTEADFATYDSAEEAFSHFDDLVMSSPRYQGALSALNSGGGWFEWLQGLQRAGYATDPEWPDKIANLTVSVRRIAGNELPPPSKIAPRPQGGPTGSPPPDPTGPQGADRYTAMANQLWQLLSAVREEAAKAKPAGADPVLDPAEAAGVLNDDELKQIKELTALWADAQAAATGNVKDAYKLETDYADAANKWGLETFKAQHEVAVDENARRVAEYNAEIARVSNQIAAGQLTLAQANAQIDRWVKARTDSRERATFVENALKEAGAYALPTDANGNPITDLTGKELGPGISSLYKLAGVANPEDTVLAKYGSRTVDPAALLREYDAQAGGGGTIPEVPDVTSGVTGAGAPPKLAPYETTLPERIKPPPLPDFRSIFSDNTPGRFSPLGAAGQVSGEATVGVPGGSVIRPPGINIPPGLERFGLRPGTIPLTPEQIAAAKR